MHRTGQGGDKDEAGARELNAAACNGGYGPACYNAGLMAYTGMGGPVDLQGARMFFDNGCKGGDPKGCYNLGKAAELGKGGEKDLELARVSYDLACKKGDPAGCLDLGVMVYQGSGSSPDPTYARALFERACNGGNGFGCYNLGVMFDASEGGPQDKARARILFEQGCKLDNGNGCYRAAVMCDKAEGGAPDPSVATALAQKAIDLGNTEAEELLFWLTEKQSADKTQERARLQADVEQLKNDIEVDEVARVEAVKSVAQLEQLHAAYQLVIDHKASEAIKILLPLAMVGSSDAQHLLGHAFFNGGGGLQPNELKAYAWYALAAAQGDEDAKESLEELLQDMPPDELEVAENELEETKKLVKQVTQAGDQKQVAEEAKAAQEEQVKQAELARAKAKTEAEAKTIQEEKGVLDKRRNELAQADISGIRLGMPAQEAERAIRAGMEVGWLVTLPEPNPPTGVDYGLKPNLPYREVHSFISADGTQQIALYVNKNDDRVLAVARTTLLSEESISEAAVAKELAAKYGEPSIGYDEDGNPPLGGHIVWTVDYGDLSGGGMGMNPDAFAFWKHGGCEASVGNINQYRILEGQTDPNGKMETKDGKEIRARLPFIRVEGGAVMTTSRMFANPRLGVSAARRLLRELKALTMAHTCTTQS